MKQIITILIIIMAVFGAGFLGYKALTSTVPDTTDAAVSQSSILPYGTTLQFDAVKKYNKDGKLFQYPVVTPADIGPDLGSVIR